MKKILFSFFTLISITPFAFAQNIVSTVPQYKSTVLEEYTGIRCQYCPDGHLKAKQLKADYPGRVVLVNIHQGGYANPQPGEPDFRTPYGNALAAQTNLTGYPTGTVNRTIFPEISSTMAMSRASWRTAAEKVMKTPSPVNLGAATSYDHGTRTITIDLEAYYTDDAEKTTNFVNIALIQDSILGPQTGASTWNPGDMVNGQYRHGHMLRDLVTGQWGDTITSTTENSLFSKTYTYTIPNDVNGVPIVPEDCHLAIYVTEDRTNITQGITVGIDGDSNDGNHAIYYGDFTEPSASVVEGATSAPTSFSFDAEPTMAGDYIFELSSDAPSDWAVSFSVDGNPHSSGDTLSLAANPVTVNLEALPGATNALAKMSLKATPLADTSATMLQETYVIKGITDLIVNGSGSFGNGNSYDWGQLYVDGLNYAGSDAHAITEADVMLDGFDANAFGSVRNIYLNIGWTFPSINDTEFNAIKDFMDNGGNLFISGQDIGWDMNDNGSVLTKYFYRNYLRAEYLDDGDGNNSSLTNADTSDRIFGGVGTSQISPVYGGSYFYPDVIKPIKNSKAIFNYNNDTSRVAGIRYGGNYKLVYLAIGVEMLANTGVKNEILRLAHEWFNEDISVEEFDARMAKLQLYPNPTTNGEVNFAGLSNGSYEISVVNASGKEVYREIAEANSAVLTLDLGHLPKGIYFVNAGNKKNTYTEKLIIR